jgi:hypothetical protein
VEYLLDVDADVDGESDGNGEQEQGAAQQRVRNLHGAVAREKQSCSARRRVFLVLVVGVRGITTTTRQLKRKAASRRVQNGSNNNNGQGQAKPLRSGWGSGLLKRRTRPHY